MYACACTARRPHLQQLPLQVVNALALLLHHLLVLLPGSLGGVQRLLQRTVLRSSAPGQLRHLLHAPAKARGQGAQLRQLAIILLAQLLLLAGVAGLQRSNLRGTQQAAYW